MDTENRAAPEPATDPGDVHITVKAADAIEEDADANLSDWELFIIPNVALQIACQSADGALCSSFDTATDGSTQKYEISGPLRTLRHLKEVIAKVSTEEAKERLQKAADVSLGNLAEQASAANLSKRASRKSIMLAQLQGLAGGTLSPLHELDGLDTAAKGSRLAKIPNARYRAFVYPARGLEDELEQINVTEYPWASLLLFGGFAYFDESRKPIELDALSLAPSSIALALRGPLPVTSEVASTLQGSGRFEPVTIDSLEEHGMSHFAWVHPREVLSQTGGAGGFLGGGDGQRRCSSPHQLAHQHADEQGAFVYQVSSGQYVYFAARFRSVGQANAIGQALKREAATTLFGKGSTRVQRMGWHVRRELMRRREEAAMIMQLTAASEGGQQRLRVLLGHMMLALMPTACGASLVLVLGSLARYDTRCFKVLAALIWFSLQVSVMWIPLRDTSGVAILCHSKLRMLRMQLILSSIPICLTLLILFAHLGSWSGYTIGIEATQLCVEGLSLLLVYVLVPIALYYFRLKTSDDVQTEVKRSYASVSRMQKSLYASVEASSSTVGNACASPPVASSEAGGPPPSPPPSPPVTQTRRNVRLHKASYTSNSTLRARGEELRESGFSEAENRAATRLQSAWRRCRDRKAAASQMHMRQQALLYFSWPIYLASLLDLVSSFVFATLTARGYTPTNLLSLVTFGLCLLVFVRDANKEPPIRFSLSHGVFFVAILYRLSFKAATIDQEIWTGVAASRLGAMYPSLVPLLTLGCHYALYITVTSIGMSALTLVSTTAACVHLLFFFQFFDFFL